MERCWSVFGWGGVDGREFWDVVGKVLVAGFCSILGQCTHMFRQCWSLLGQNVGACWDRVVHAGTVLEHDWTGCWSILRNGGECLDSVGAC